MSTLAAFFKESDTQFGVYYPKHCLMAMYPSLPDADQAQARLVNSGIPRKDVVAVPGEDLLQLAAEHTSKDGLWGWLMRHLSRAFSTEAVYADGDLDSAAHGAAVVAVYCPQESTKLAAWDCLKNTHPLVARYYGSIGIDHLAGEV
jgi:hypothetical protein